MTTTEDRLTRALAHSPASYTRQGECGNYIIALANQSAFRLAPNVPAMQAALRIQRELERVIAGLGGELSDGTVNKTGGVEWSAIPTNGMKTYIHRGATIRPNTGLARNWVAEDPRGDAAHGPRLVYARTLALARVAAGRIADNIIEQLQQPEPEPDQK